MAEAAVTRRAVFVPSPYRERVRERGPPATS
jgi:hypothetical protein